MCKENLYVKMEKLEVQICRCTRQGFKVLPCVEGVVCCNSIKDLLSKLPLLHLLRKLHFHLSLFVAL